MFIVVGTQTWGLPRSRLRDQEEKQNQEHLPKLTYVTPCILCKLEIWLLETPRLTFPGPNSKEKQILIFSGFMFKHTREGF